MHAHLTPRGSRTQLVTSQGPMGRDAGELSRRADALVNLPTSPSRPGSTARAQECRDRWACHKIRV